jgi:predicted amidohydrolase
VRVAAFQMPPVFDDVRAAVAAIRQSVSWAADQGAELAVFPEAYLHGHSDDRDTIARRARSLDDPEVVELVEALRGFPVTVVAGMFERRGSSLRNVALVLRSIGNLIARAQQARCWVVSSDVTVRARINWTNSFVLR